MRTELELFEMYKEEKAHIIGDFNERTGLEAFPTFKNWKEAYIKDYLRNHVEVSEKDADRMMDAAVEEAEAELEEMMARGASKTEVEEAGIRVEEAKAKKAERKEAKKAKRAAKRKADEEAGVITRKPRAKKAKAVSNKAKGTGEKRTVNKAAIARGIFNEFYPKVVAGEMKRADIIAKFLDAGLTKAGASTYHQKFKKEYNEGKLK